MLTTIPFSGFYETLHDSIIEDTFDGFFQDDSGDVNGDLLNHAFSSVQFATAHRKYAAAYAVEFAEHIEAALTFESMTSPREYNFSTDTIFCQISESEVHRIIATLPDGALAFKAKERFTSRSGFVSFYSPDIAEWGDVSEWDHNQVGTVIECLADTFAAYGKDNWNQWDEFGLMENYSGNGYLANWIIEGSPKKFLRVVNIADYLRQREQRG